jgi:hypothetical protein
VQCCPKSSLPNYPDASAWESRACAEHLIHCPAHSRASGIVVAAKDAVLRNLWKPREQILPDRLIRVIGVQENQVDRTVREMLARPRGIFPNDLDSRQMAQHGKILEENGRYIMYGGFLVSGIAKIRLPSVDSIQSIVIRPADIENRGKGTPFPDTHLNDRP